MRPRTKNRSLTGSRIYIRGKSYALFSSVPIENPFNGKIAKWHTLCKVSEGEIRARQYANEIHQHNKPSDSVGNLPIYVEQHRIDLLKRREKDRPKEAAREKMFNETNKELSRECRVIGAAFINFDIDEVVGVDIAKFVDQWHGQRMAQVWMSRLSDFFKWAIRRGLRNDNPCDNITVEKPTKRRRYLSDHEWHTARDSLLIGLNGRKTPSGEMVQCYVDLCYLLYQRTTEIRLLKWSQIDEHSNVINFMPTKTEKSSGISVAVSITNAVKVVLDRAKGLSVNKASAYVIHSSRGKPYTANGIGTAWRRACARAGIKDATTKDIRAKAATDAKKAGYTKEQISIGLAHTDQGMTEHYLRGRETNLSPIVLSLPQREKTQ